MAQKPYLDLIKQALAEDQVDKDITSFAIFGKKGGKREGIIKAKSGCVVSGLDVARDVFFKVNPRIKLIGLVKDGSWVKPGTKMAKVKGDIVDLLRAERVALNFLQRLSGVATLTRQFVMAVKAYDCDILDTRKTTPGMRWLEKRAVIHGAGKNHRFDLSDLFLVKDNHIAACGGIEQAVARLKASRFKKKIEVEVTNLKQLQQALEAQVDMVLLDNMTPAMMKKAVSLCKGKCLTEASGGVNLKTVVKTAATGVDRISIGALTHSAPAADISFDI